MKSATERLYELMWKIQEEYKGIITTKDKTAIDSIILNRISTIKKEETEYLEDLHNEAQLNALESQSTEY